MGTAGRDGGGGDGGLFGREEQREGRGSPIPCTELPAGRTDVAGPLYRAQQGERGGGEPINALQYSSSRQGGGNGALQGGERDGESIPGECILLSS